MPRPPLSDDEIREFRQQLCAIATRLFAQHGYAGVTLRGLAKELGVSAMTPYRYFRSKDEILTEARRAGFERFAQSQEEAYRSADNPVGRIRAISTAYHRFASENPDVYRIMFELHQPQHEKQPQLRRAYRRAFRPVQRSVGEAIDAGLLTGDRDTLAHMVWVVCHGLASLHLAGMLVLGRTLDVLEEPTLREILRGASPGNVPVRSRRRPHSL